MSTERLRLEEAHAGGLPAAEAAERIASSLAGNAPRGTTWLVRVRNAAANFRQGGWDDLADALDAIGAAQAAEIEA